MLAHQPLEAAALARLDGRDDLAMVGLRQDHDFAVPRRHFGGPRVAAQYRLRRSERQLVVERQRRLKRPVGAGLDDQAMEGTVHLRPAYVIVETIACLADDGGALLQALLQGCQQLRTRTGLGHQPCRAAF